MFAAIALLARPAAAAELAILDSVCDVDCPFCENGVTGLAGARSPALGLVVEPALRALPVSHAG